MDFILPSTSFYLLRHGESEANLAGLAAGGGVDCALTRKGEQQAYELADLIDQLQIKPSIIFVSPMQRAKRTAEIINTHLNLSIEIIPNLEEHHIGRWEGQKWSEIGPKMIAGEIPPGGENYEQYAERLKGVLGNLLAKTLKSRPLIVAHGGTFHSIGHMYGWKMLTTKNCHLHRFMPYPDHAAFPWQVLEYNVNGADLREVRSAYCPLHSERAKI